MRSVGIGAASDRANSREAGVSSNGTARSRCASSQQNARPMLEKLGTIGAPVPPSVVRLRSLFSVAEMKARQVTKMREIRAALVAEGCMNLDDQAAALGLPRSTTWTIIKANHKSSGLSAAVLTRILSAPNLQPAVRNKILEYIEEKSLGHYGGSKERLKKFIDRIKGNGDRAGG